MTVDLTVLYVHGERTIPDSVQPVPRGGMLAQMTLFISGSGLEVGGARKVSVYTVSRSTSLGQAPSCTRLPACVLPSLAMHARTSLCLCSPPSLAAATLRCRDGIEPGVPASREGSTRTGAHTCPRNGVKIRVATLLARRCCVSPRIRAG